MRLSKVEESTVVKAVAALDPAAKVYLYGSRTKDQEKGGDIDLLILSEILEFHDKISILTDIKMQLGDQKIDILIRSASSAVGDPFVSKIIGSAIQLHE